MRVSPVLAAALTLAVLTFGATDCSGTGNGTEPRASASPSAPKPPSQAVRIGTNSTCPVMGDLEGKFTKSSQMDEYLACIVPSIEQWVGVAEPTIRHPKNYYFIPLGVTGADDKCKYDDKTLFYCLSTESVYFGEVSTWTQYTQHGDASAALIMAHEVTHHFQNVANMPPATVPNEQIRYENQADCGGGAFMRYAQSQGWITSLTDDVVDVVGALAAAGSYPGPKQDHGTSAERLTAVGRGALSRQPNPLVSCNTYVPEVALVS